MRRVEVTYRPAAISDIRRIYRAVFEKSRNRKTAALYVQRIYERCERISNAPLGGRPRDDLRPGLRSVPFERTASIVYEFTDVVEIVNVFPRGWDYEARFRDPDAPAS